MTSWKQRDQVCPHHPVPHIRTHIPAAHSPPHSSFRAGPMMRSALSWSVPSPRLSQSSEIARLTSGASIQIEWKAISYKRQGTIYYPVFIYYYFVYNSVLSFLFFYCFKIKNKKTRSSSKYVMVGK